MINGTAPTVFSHPQMVEASRMGDSSNDSESAAEFPPEKRLEAPNTWLIDAGIATIRDMETLRACVAYENANQQRVQILRRLENRASELRSQDS